MLPTKARFSMYSLLVLQLVLAGCANQPAPTPAGGAAALSTGSPGNARHAPTSASRSMPVGVRVPVPSHVEGLVVLAARDTDRDGFNGSADCNDLDPRIHPGAREVACNGVDEDCDGKDLCGGDADHDGVHAPLDCRDDDPRIHPYQQEIFCNGIDENCDGTDWCDADGDKVPSTLDCDDHAPSVHRGAKEIACNGIDEDCDGRDCCGQDLDHDGFACDTDCDDHDATIHPNASDSCDGVDRDCDGRDAPRDAKDECSV